MAIFHIAFFFSYSISNIYQYFNEKCSELIPNSDQAILEMYTLTSWMARGEKSQQYRNASVSLQNRKATLTTPKS